MRSRELSAATGGRLGEIEYVELAKSGCLPPRKRPALQRALTDARAREYDRLLIYDVRRLSRGFDLSGWLRVELAEAGVEVLDTMRHGQGETARYADTLAGAIERDAMAQRSRDTARRVRANRAKYGAANLYGTRWVDKRRRVADPETGPMILSAFERTAAGEILGGIAADLGRSRAWLLKHLRHPGYVGAYTYGYSRRSVPTQVIEGVHEALIPADLWAAVQARLDRQALSMPWHNPGQAVLPLTGLLRCNRCAEPMRLARERRRRTDGVLVRYYSCGRCRLAAPVTDGWPPSILAAVLSRLRQPGIPEEIAAALNEGAQAEEQTGNLRQDLAALEGRERNLVAAIESGELPDVSALSRRLASVQAAQERTRARLAAQRSRTHVPVSPRAIEAALMRLIAAGAVPDRASLHALVETLDMRSRSSGLIRVRQSIGAIAEPTLCRSTQSRPCHLAALSVAWAYAA